MYHSGFDYLTHPFIGMCVSILITAGFAQCGRWFAHCVDNDADQVGRAAGFIIVVGLCGVVIHVMALCGLLRLWWLRGVGGAFALVGVWWLVTWRPNIALIKHKFKQTDRLEQVGWCVVVTIFVALLFAALAPATDGDSLYYHLGVPVDWLNAGGAVARPVWLHAHLIGLGEMINLLGLAMGASNLGAVVQYGSLWVILIGLTAEAQRKQRLVVVLMVVCAPVVVALVPTQKPQMLPVAGTTIALILLVRSSLTNVTISTLILAFGAVAVAIGCKYTALVTGGIIILFGLWKAWKSKLFWQAVGIAAGLTLLFAGTIWLRNWMFYGDPLSPFLHDLLTPNELIRGGFAAYLRDYGVEGWSLWERLVVFVVPFELGLVTAVLGVGVFGCFFTTEAQRTQRFAYIVVALIATIALLFTSQLTPRFFIEPYIWGAIVVGVSTRLRWGKLLTVLLTMQGIGVAMLAVFAAVTLFPGSLTPTRFDATMARTVEGYELHDWLDEALPADAVIYVDLRLGMVLPRPFLAADFGRYWHKIDLPPDDLLREFLTEFEKAKMERGVTHLVLDEESIRTKPWSELPCVGEPITESEFVYGGGRNPFGRDDTVINLLILPITC